jgi:CxxC-x17-CxxC domain-containing protein
MRLLTEEDIVARFGETVCQDTSKTNDARRSGTKTVTGCTQCGKRITVCFVPLPGLPVLCKWCLRLRKQWQQATASGSQKEA